jgi:acyl-CoA synthetase (AMP-forming)/AMP-acid ligase II
VAAGELAGQLADAGASVLVTVPPFLEVARAAAATAGVAEVLVFGEAEGATPFASLLDRRPGRRRRPRPRPQRGAVAARPPGDAQLPQPARGGQVPRSPTGKLLRRVLVEAERADAEAERTRAAVAEAEPAGVA